METMSLADRIASYEKDAGFPNCLFIGEDGRLVGTWVMGNNYRVKSSYYGGYPPTYLRRIKALFPDKLHALHLFSGKVDLAEFPGVTVDSNASTEPDIIDDAHRLEKVPIEDFDLVMADPPYSVEDCDHYQCTMVKRNIVMRALGSRLKAGAHVVWLDQVLPMYRKADFEVEGYVGMVKSTNHRFRVVTIFRKKEQARVTPA